MKKILPKNAIVVPDNAIRVFSGQIFDVFQWPQQMYDGSEAIFEMLKRADTVQVVAVKDGEIVVVYDEQPGRAGRLHFPGGRVDPEDGSWEAAAQREMLEETGMTFNNWKLIAVQQPVPKAEWFVPFFLAVDLMNEQSQQLDAGEKIRVETRKFEKLREDVLTGQESTLSYAIPLFNRYHSLNELLYAKVFEGQEVDR